MTWLAGTLAVALAGALGVFLNTVAEGAGTAVVEQVRRSANPSPPQATSAAEPFAASVAIDYRLGSVNGFALPAPLLGGPEATTLRAGFASDAEWQEFLRRTGGAPRDTVTVRLVLTGKTQPSVRFTDLRVHKVVRTERLAGTEIHLVEGGGETGTIRLNCDLDTPAATLVDQHGSDYFTAKNIELGPGERVTFVAGFHTGKSTYGWELELSYIDGQGASHTTYLDATGRQHSHPAKAAKPTLFWLTGSVERYGATYTENTPARGFTLLSASQPRR